MTSIKLIPMSRIGGRSGSGNIDSIREKQKLGDARALNVLLEAQNAWCGMYKFRKERERNKRYKNGDQWGDIIYVEGRRIREEDYIKGLGNVPLKNNVISKLVRTVISSFRSQSKEPTCMARDRDEQQYGETMTTVLQCNMQLNKMKLMHARTMEEFLISGLAVHHKWYGWNADKSKLDCWTDNVQANNFFVDANMRDLRGWDVSLIGEIHDESFETLCSKYVKTPSDKVKLSKIYSVAHDVQSMEFSYGEFGHPLNANEISFLVPNDASRCRVIEVWRKETKPRYRCHDYNNGDVYKIDVDDLETMVLQENDKRMQMGIESGMSEDEIPLINYEWFMDEYWYYYMLTPFGDILEEGETPYWHHSHPYVFTPYPFIDGEIHAFVSDFIDQQRYINRLITMYDWIMRASAKGVLIFPEDCLPENVSMDDITHEWAKFNGVIVIKKGAQNLPQQIANNATNIGISELLNLQLKLIEDISGASSSLQGKPGYSGMSASLYAQQTQNAMTSLLDIFETYSSFILDGAEKDVKNIQQFYDERRVKQIAGKGSTFVEYDPEKLRNIDFDLSIIESTNTPTYRTIANDMLMQMWQAGAISVKQMLEVGDFPFSDQLLQSINSQEQQVQNGQVPDGMSPQLMQQAQQGADMNAVNKAHDMLLGRGAA